MKSTEGTPQAQAPAGIFHIQSEKDWALAMEALEGAEPGAYRLEVRGHIRSLRDMGDSLRNLPGSILIDLNLSAATGIMTIGADAFRDCTSLTSVAIPASVTTIGGSAFEGCTSLARFMVEEGNGHFSTDQTGRMLLSKDGAVLLSWPTASGDIAIPETVTTIGAGAFFQCYSLTSVAIPASVTTIEQDAFCHCKSLARLMVEEGNGHFSTDPTGRMLLSKDGAVLLSWPTASGDIAIPETVTTIGAAAFEGCTSLASVTIPASVTAIEGSAFRGCSSLTSVDIPHGVTEIRAGAFSGCTSLASVTIPASVTAIEGLAFRGCSSLASVTIPDGVTTIGGSAFSGCTSLASVTIPHGVTEIGTGAFNDCTSLASVTIPASVTAIGPVIFHGCTSLSRFMVEEGNVFFSTDPTGRMLLSKDGTALLSCPAASGDITIPHGVKTIGDWWGLPQPAFYDCSSLTSVTIPASVTSISSSAFEGCTGLTSVTFADSSSTWTVDGQDVEVDNPSTNATNLTKTYVFDEWKKKSLTIPHGVTTITIAAFRGCTWLTSVTIPASVTRIGPVAFAGCTSLARFMVEEGNEHFSTDSTGRMLLSKDGTALLSWPAASGDITIPHGITRIGWGAFNGCSSLTSVAIPASVTEIGTGAFRNCTSLASLTIPDGVTTIRDNAFYGCTSLSRFMVEEGNGRFSTDPTGRMLLSKDGTALLSWPAASGDITIPHGITRIGWRAFNGYSSLTSVAIPASVTSIEPEIFNGCTSLSRFMVEEGNVFFSTDSTGRMLLSKDGTALFSWPAASGDITIPASVTTIEWSAFNGCTGLTSVTFADSSSTWTVYGQDVEVDNPSTNATNLTKTYSHGVWKKKSLTIPHGVTTIEKWAFEGCDSLESAKFEDEDD